MQEQRPAYKPYKPSLTPEEEALKDQYVARLQRIHREEDAIRKLLFPLLYKGHYKG